MYVRALAWFLERRETLLSCPVCFTLVITVIVCVILKTTSSLGRQLIPNICTLCTEDRSVAVCIRSHNKTQRFARAFSMNFKLSSDCNGHALLFFTLPNKQAGLFTQNNYSILQNLINCGRFSYLHLGYNKFVFKNQKRRHNTSGDIQCIKQIPWFSLNSTHVPQYYQSK